VKYLLIDTNVIIRRLRGAIDDKTWNALLAGSAPVISPVSLHELRRGIRPRSAWEKEKDESLVPTVNPPTEEDWILAADLIRNYFWNTHKGPNLARLQNDALIAVTAKRLGAQLWSKDGEMKVFCDALGVQLFTE
jgi:predicted nucleic acid-binding protein